MRTADPALNPSAAAALQMASPPPPPPRPHAGGAAGRDGPGGRRGSPPGAAPGGGGLLPGAGRWRGRPRGLPVRTPPHTCSPPRSGCETREPCSIPGSAFPELRPAARHGPARLCTALHGPARPRACLPCGTSLTAARIPRVPLPNAAEVWEPQASPHPPARPPGMESCGDPAPWGAHWHRLPCAPQSDGHPLPRDPPAGRRGQPRQSWRGVLAFPGARGAASSPDASPARWPLSQLPWQ